MSTDELKELEEGLIMYVRKNHHLTMKDLAKHFTHRNDQTYYWTFHDLKNALENLTNDAKLNYDGNFYTVNSVWDKTKSQVLSKINKKIGILEMKHIKTFETFGNFDPEMSMTACPTCHSENVDNLGNGQLECVECGQVFDDPAYAEVEMQDRAIEEEEEEFMDTPELDASELETYQNSDEQINKIISNATAMDPVLADQLKYEAEGCDSYEDFMRRAEACIQDVKGVDRETAIEILTTLM